MILNGRFRYVGISSRHDKNDLNKVYHNISLLQGTDAMRVNLKQDQIGLVTKCKELEEVEITLDIFVSKDYTIINLLDIKPISAVK